MSASAIKAGEAYVQISARDQQFVAALEQNRERMQGFVGQLQQMATQFALDKIKESLTLFPEYGDQLNKMAIRTGFTAQALSELDFAAARSGASISDLEQAVTGMNRFLLQAERALAKAAEKGDDLKTAMRQVEAGPVVRTLKDLQLNAEAFFKSSPEQRFMMLAGAIGDIDDPGRKSALAMQVFGRSATTLLPLLNEGSEGMAKLRSRARDLGKTMSDETAADAAAWVDANEDLARSIDGLLLKLAQELAPVITELTTAVADLIAEYGDSILVAAEVAGAMVAIGVALKVVNSALALYASRAAIAQAFSGPAGWVTLAATLGVVAGAVHAVNDALDETNQKTVDNATGSVTKLKNELAGVNGDGAAIGINTEELETAEHRLEALVRRIQTLNDLNRPDLIGPVEELAAAAQAQVNALKDAGQMASDSAALADMLAKQGSEAKKTAEQLDVIDRRIRRIKAGTDDGSVSLVDAQALRDDVTGFADAMEDARTKLAKLNGDLTDTDILLDKLAKSGVGDEQIDKLRDVFAAIGNREQEQLIAKEAAEKRESLEGRAAEIRQALKTPEETLADLNDELQSLVEASVLSAADAEAYLAARVADAADQIKARGNALEQQVVRESSQDLRTSEGAKLLANLLNGNQSIEERQLLTQKKIAANTDRDPLQTAKI